MKTSANDRKNISGNLFVKFAFYYLMKLLKVQRYSAKHKKVWDDFVSKVESHSILFYRDYMEYHSDRFTDYSLMVYEDQKLIAIMPANIDENDDVHSHQGLSYGGVLNKSTLLFVNLLEVYQKIVEFLSNQKIKNLIIKHVPSCFTISRDTNLIFSWLESDKYRTDIYSFIPKRNYDKPNKDRLRHIKKAIKKNFKVKRISDFAIFWDKLLIPNLLHRYNVKPVHKSSEIQFLAEFFPENILCYGLYEKEVLRAGVVLFKHNKVVHTQYIAGDKNRKDGGLDYLIDYLILKYNGQYIFSFGSSSENNGNQINSGLLYWKESFFSLNGIQEFYKIKTIKHSKLMSRL